MYPIGRTFTLCLIIRLTEGRVYCQDTHASPWIPLGYTCPVMCQNILNAIERLKIMDYRKMIEEDKKKRDRVNASYMKTLVNSINTETATGTTPVYKKPWKHEERDRDRDRSLRYQEQVKSLKTNKNKAEMHAKENNYFDIYIDNSIETGAETLDKMASKQDGALRIHEQTVMRGLKLEFNVTNAGRFVDMEMRKEIGESFAKMAAYREGGLVRELRKALANRTCDWFRSKEPYVMIKKMIRRCGARSRRYGYGEDFLRTLTRTMNRYSKGSFEFTEDMVELVLERVFGKNEESQQEVFDVSKLLHYLRNAMEVHKQHTERGTTIVLRPRHCLSLSIPGCFCRPGFVESSGQCVKPADCVMDSSNEHYLSRIVVH